MWLDKGKVELILFQNVDKSKSLKNLYKHNKISIKLGPKSHKTSG